MSIPRHKDRVGEGIFFLFIRRQFVCDHRDNIYNQKLMFGDTRIVETDAQDYVEIF